MNSTSGFRADGGSLMAPLRQGEGDRLRQMLQAVAGGGPAETEGTEPPD